MMQDELSWASKKKELFKGNQLKHFNTVKFLNAKLHSEFPAIQIEKLLIDKKCQTKLINYEFLLRKWHTKVFFLNEHFAAFKAVA
jgi:hypothetical protein